MATAAAICETIQHEPIATTPARLYSRATGCGRGAGMQSARLRSQTLATGCVAKHLPTHLEQCRSVSRRWDEWLLEADAARAAAQSSAVLRAAGRAVSARPRGRRVAE